MTAPTPPNRRPGWDDAPSWDPKMANMSEDARRDRLKPILISDLKNLPPRQYLIKGLLGMGEMSVWFGEPGCGKSFLVMTTGLSIARGVDWFGRRMKGGLVVYIAAEGGGGIRKRLEAFCQHHGIEPEGVPFAVIPTSVDLLNEYGDTTGMIDGVKALEKELGITCRMFVVDTLSRCLAGGDENSPGDMGNFITNCDRIREATGAHIAIVHHTPKAERTTPRGHSSLLGATDVAIKIEKHPDGNTATVEKNKDDEDGWGVSFRLEQVTVGTDEDGDEITSCVVVEMGEPPPKAPKPLRGHKARAMEALELALIDHGKTMRGHRNIPEGAVCVAEEKWRASFYAKSTGEQETKKKAFQRAVHDLQDMGRVGVYDGEVWIVKIKGLPGHNGHNGTMSRHVPRTSRRDIPGHHP